MEFRDGNYKDIPFCCIQFFLYLYSVWNFETGTKLSHFENGNRKSTKITAMELLNSHDLPLLLTGSSKKIKYFI